ncbi:hypothetical protein FKM82_023123 [Ascaphus truei]
MTLTLLRSDWRFSADSALRNWFCCRQKIPVPQHACGRLREPPLKTSSLRMMGLIAERPHGSVLTVLLWTQPYAKFWKLSCHFVAQELLSVKCLMFVSHGVDLVLV